MIINMSGLIRYKFLNDTVCLVTASVTRGGDGRNIKVNIILGGYEACSSNFLTGDTIWAI